MEKNARTNESHGTDVGSSDPEHLRVIKFCHQILETSSKIECNSCKRLYAVEEFVEHLADCKSPTSSAERNPMLMAGREDSSIYSNVSRTPLTNGTNKKQTWAADSREDPVINVFSPGCSNEGSPRYMFDENLSDFISAGEVQKNKVRVTGTAPQLKQPDST